MEYNHILIRYGELGLKGKNIQYFLSRLQHNIQDKLKAFPNIKVQRAQGRLYVLLNGHPANEVMDICKSIFGIHSLSLAYRCENELDEIKTTALHALKSSKNAKTFKVAVRRADKSFPIGSQEMNQKLGAHLLKNTEGFTVDVHHPDVEVSVEIRQEGTFIVSEIIPGPGGLPIGTGGKTLLLLSGGIDSPVAGYLTMKRGVQVEAIHFHSPPFTSERAKQKVVDIAEKLANIGHSIKVHFVPFTEIQQKIHQEIPDSFGMTVMRRIMLMISERIAKKRSILSLATGESLGQVASQTMESMHTINEVTNYPVLRPLLAMDKEEIVNIAKEIDTYDISIRPYEDCCTVFVPKSPKTRPTREQLHAVEEGVDFKELIDKAIEETEMVTYTDEVDDAFADFL
ncbi:MAG TPA: tRNA uracil 4-sulfurtransferase ThiI [Bacillota bacterium]|nr:tRNA uracil 4-sulfurtransferase ThiI [Bacillota bacterium]